MKPIDFRWWRDSALNPPPPQHPLQLVLDGEGIHTKPLDGRELLTDHDWYPNDSYKGPSLLSIACKSKKQKKHVSLSFARAQNRRICSWKR